MLKVVAGQHNETVTAEELLTSYCRQSVASLMKRYQQESLLSAFGTQFVERIEARAAADGRFRRCLAGVWQGGMSDALWARVT